MPEPIYEKGQEVVNPETVRGKMRFERIKHHVNSLAHTVADLESIQSQLSEEDWVGLGDLLKNIYDKIEDTREDVIVLKEGIAKIQAKSQK